jgi:ATP-dependent DNA helicase RecG
MSDKMSEKMSDKERQRLEIILNYLKENTSITSSKAAELIGKEIKTANRLLVKAVNLGLFKTEGEYKNRIYLLK